MSMCSSFVQTQEKHWFRDPTVWGEENSWFICWDDDDPIELVIKKSSDKTVDDILKSLEQKGWHLRLMHKGNGGERIFDHSGHDFEPAHAYFLRQLKGGPTDEMFKGCEKANFKPFTRDGVYYELGGG